MLAYLSLGSNLGNREAHIDAACQRINELCGTIVRRSDNFYSMPWGYTSDHEYLNICLAVETDLTPIVLLDATQAIEHELGRTLKNCYADRTIDIDLLRYYNKQGNEIRLQSERLTLPHPHINERDFVLVPLAQIQS